MDTDALRKLLAYLIAQPQFVHLLETLAEHSEGEVHLLSADEGDAQEYAKHTLKAKLLLNVLAKTHPELAAELRKIAESGDAPPVVLIVVEQKTHEGGRRPTLRRPRTLREAIDQEWPW